MAGGGKGAREEAEVARMREEGRGVWKIVEFRFALWANCRELLVKSRWGKIIDD